MIKVDIGSNKAGVFRVRGDEDFLKGHFPGNPIVPMTIMGAAMIKYAFQGKDGIPVVTGLSIASKAIVKPGDEVIITAEGKDKRENFGGFPAVYGRFMSRVGDQVVAEAVVEGYMVPSDMQEFRPVPRHPINIGFARVFADKETVMRILPHRDPMLFIPGSLLEWDNFGVGTVFQPAEDFPFAERWLGTDIKVIPIWALAEAMGQEGIAYLSHNQWPDTPVKTLATGLSIRQFEPVLAGDRLMLKLELRRPLKLLHGTHFGKGIATAFMPATGRIVAMMECMASVTPPAA